MVEAAPAGLQRERDVGEIRIEMRLQMVAQVLRGGIERRNRPGGEKHQLRWPGRRAGSKLGRLLEDDVRIGAAYAKGTYASAPRNSLQLPIAHFGIDVERAIREIEIWIGF